MKLVYTPLNGSGLECVKKLLAKLGVTHVTVVPEQEESRELTPAEARANWWHYHWYYVALIAAVVLALGYFAWQRATTVEPDDTVTVVGRTEPDEAFLSALETKLESLSEDVNDDGKIKVEVKGVWLDLRLNDNEACGVLLSSNG